ncbi:MAG: DNA primase [Candidatus Omnitrophica bacterium]|nr:DNA primase [Candidatus Omnitrophota bacterium]
MAGFIGDNVIDEILSRVDIVEFISSYFPLKKTGRNFKTICPFHKEKTPSFIVSPDKQIFHCFGCNEGGNAIHFLMRYEHLEFPEAVKILAKRAGVVIPEIRKESKGVLDVYKINNLAMQFYHNILLNSSQSEGIRKYLSKRGLEKATWEKFKLGFAPTEGNILRNFLKNKGVAMDLAERTGLIVHRIEKDGYFDFFHGRIIFPIFDIRQRVIGFGGRILDDSLPKYINTPETIAYKKGENLYGLNFTRESIREKGVVIIVEGYMDLISLYQAGVNNVVATLGTALTPEQARLIKRHTSSVVIVYDGDKAGESASLRGIEVLLESGLEVRLVALPQGFDPDSFVRLKGKDNFNRLLKEAKNILEYKLQTLTPHYDIRKIEDKVKLIKEILPTLSKIENKIMLSEFVKQLADKLSVSEESVWIEFKKICSKNKNFEQKGFSLPETNTVIPSIREAEITLLKIMLKDKSLIKEAKALLGEEEFLSPQIKNIIGLLYTLAEENKPIEPARVVNYLGEVSANKVFTRLLVEEDFGEAEQKFDTVFSDCVKKLKEDNRRKICLRLKEEISDAQKKGDTERIEELLKEFNALARQRD